MLGKLNGGRPFAVILDSLKKPASPAMNHVDPNSAKRCCTGHTIRANYKLGRRLDARWVLKSHISWSCFERCKRGRSTLPVCITFSSTTTACANIEYLAVNYLSSYLPHVLVRRYTMLYARVAQLDRALVSGTKGRGFESLRAYQTRATELTPAQHVFCY